MVLAWDTYRAIPHLPDYATAKNWYDNTTPIRGDAHGTRPVGRRDQKWFHIWETKDAINVGYGTPERPQPIVTYRKEGSIILPSTSSNASTHERLSRLLGATFKTHQYDTWVHCAYFDNGEEKYGWMPILYKSPAIFMRGGRDDKLFYVNYKYPVTHKINKKRMNAKLDEFGAFLTYLSSLVKLHGEERMRFSEETKVEAFGVNPFYQNRNQNIANAPPNLRWGVNMQENREQFFAWAKSDDAMDQLRAVITVVNMSHWDHPADTFKEYVIRTYKQAVLDAVEHRDGRLVRDRLRNLLL